MNEIILDIAISMIGVAIGTAGVAMMYNVGNRVFVYAVIGAVLSGLAYEIFDLLLENIFIVSMLASGIAAIYSEIMAHILKIPVTVTLILGIIPLVPGSLLYYTMFGLVSGDGAAASENARNALFVSLGIALGIIIVTLITRAVFPSIISKSAEVKHRKR